MYARLRVIRWSTSFARHSPVRVPLADSAPGLDRRASSCINIITSAMILYRQLGRRIAARRADDACTLLPKCIYDACHEKD